MCTYTLTVHTLRVVKMCCTCVKDVKLKADHLLALQCSIPICVTGTTA